MQAICEWSNYSSGTDLFEPSVPNDVTIDKISEFVSTFQEVSTQAQKQTIICCLVLYLSIHKTYR